MNRLRLIIPTLIQINIVVAILSVVFVIIMREQQAQITASTQESVNQPNDRPRQIKDKISLYQEKIQQNHQKIQGYEQQLKGLKAELEEYKAQNALLMRLNSPKSSPVTAVVANNSQTSASSSAHHLTYTSGVNSKKQTSSKSIKSGVSSPSHSVSSSSIVQVKPSVTPFQSLEIADTISTVSIDVSSLESPQQLETNSQSQPTRASGETVARENNEKKANPVSSNRLNDNNNDIIAMNQIAKSKKVANNLSKSEISFISSAIRPLPLDSDRDISIHYANTVSHGLAIAADKGQINPKTQMYKQVQTAIALLRKGESMQEATRKAQVPEQVIDQLVKWGEQRPGSLLKGGETK